MDFAKRAIVRHKDLSNEIGKRNPGCYRAGFPHASEVGSRQRFCIPFLGIVPDAGNDVRGPGALALAVHDFLGRQAYNPLAMVLWSE